MIEKHGLLPGRAVVIGNVMGNPVISKSEIANGKVVTFRVIADDGVGTQTIECVAYKGLAEVIAESFKDEDRVCVEGLMNYERMVVENMLNLKPVEVNENGN